VPGVELSVLFAEGDGNEEAGLTPLGHPKVRWQYPHHRKRTSVHPELTPDDVGCATELLLPVRVAEDDLLMVSLHHLVLGERPAESRVDRQEGEERRRDPHGGYALRAASLAHGHALAIVEGHLFEGVHPFPPLEEVHRPVGCPGGPCPGVAVVDGDQAIGRVERQGLQQHGVDHAEDGHVGADADGQRHQNRGAEGLLLQQELQAKANVTHQRLHDTPSRSPSDSPRPRWAGRVGGPRGFVASRALACGGVEGRGGTGGPAPPAYSSLNVTAGSTAAARRAGRRAPRGAWPPRSTPAHIASGQLRGGHPAAGGG
jgi:hypothetical protein